MTAIPCHYDGNLLMESVTPQGERHPPQESDGHYLLPLTNAVGTPTATAQNTYSHSPFLSYNALTFELKITNSSRGVVPPETQPTANPVNIHQQWRQRPPSSHKLLLKFMNHHL